MNADYYIKEGFTPRLVVDVGWPFTSDKFMCACTICGLGMFYKIDEPKGDNEILIPVHSFCVKQAEEKYLK